MSSTNKPIGGVGSPFKAKFTQMPAGKSAIKQIEEEAKTFGENIQTIAGGVGGAVGNIKQGINNFLTTIGLEPRGEKELETDVDKETIDKSRKKLGVSQYQWDTGGVGTDVMTRAAIRKEKKKLGLQGKVVETEVANPDYVDEETTPDIDPTITKKQRQYEEYNVFTGKKNKYVWDPSAGEYKLEGQQEEEEETSIEGGVDEKPVEEETVDNDFKKDIIDYATAIDHENIPDWKKGDEISEEVKALQEGLISIYGEDILPKHGADGKMGKETRDAIKKLLGEDEDSATEDDATVDKPSKKKKKKEKDEVKHSKKTGPDSLVPTTHREFLENPSGFVGGIGSIPLGPEEMF